MATDVTSADPDQFPASAVGRVLVCPSGNCSVGPAFTCSATAIKTDVVLTAAHCFCNGTTFDNTATWRFYLWPNGVNPGKYYSGTGASTYFNDHICVQNEAHLSGVMDLAILQLNDPLPYSLVHRFPKVYTQGSGLDIVNTFGGGRTSIIGWAGGPGQGDDNLARFLAYVDPNTQELHIVNEYGRTQPILETYDNEVPGAVTWAGDSGGPLFMQESWDSDPVIVGVVSWAWNADDESASDLADNDRGFSPTWDEGGYTNGTFIQAFLSDWDDDGVRDAIDNCPPSLCPYGSCANPDQADEEHDGWGDACDLCPPSFCTQHSLPGSFCFDSSRNDIDGDGIGDNCDVCPSGYVYRPNDDLSVDNDGDAVPDVCDNCLNVYNPKQEDSDGDGIGDHCDLCPLTPSVNPYYGPSGEQLDWDSDGFGDECDGCPYTADVRWPCSAATTCVDVFPGECDSSGNECMKDSDCGSGAVCSPSHILAFPVDFDADGIPNSCDICPFVPSAKVPGNSNRIAEERETKELLGDMCDPVPVFTNNQARMVQKVETGEWLDGAVLGVDDPTARVAFLSSTRIGSVSGNSKELKQPAGVRFCPCVNDEGLPGTPEYCVDNGFCSDDPTQYSKDPANSSSTWYRMTLRSKLLSDPRAASELSSTRASNALTSTTKFNNTVECDTPDITLADSSGNCELGVQRVLFWDFLSDIENGLVPPSQFKEDGSPEPYTMGLLWGHVAGTTYASSRDSSSSGRLRDHYSSVLAPWIAYDLDPTPNHDLQTSGCFMGLCWMPWRPDWAVDPSERWDDDPFDKVQDPSLLVRLPDERVLSVRKEPEKARDVTQFIQDPGLLNLMADSGVRWVTPVEPAFWAPALKANGLQSVAVPNDWQGATSTVTTVKFQGGRLTTSRIMGSIVGDSVPEVQSDVDVAGDTEMVGASVVPEARVGARTVLSATEQRLYMVGGNRNGVATGEIWSYDLVARSWRSLDVLGSVKPSNVLAATYLPQKSQLVVLDETTASNPGQKKKGPGAGQSKRVRLLLIHVRTGEVSQILEIPRIGVLQRPSLTLTSEGEVALIAQVGTSPVWQTFLFGINGAGHIDWRGFSVGHGKLASDPFSSVKGLHVPLLEQGQLQLHLLDPSDLRTFNHACSDF